MRSSLTCPLLAVGKRVGFVFFSSDRPGAYSEHHVELLTLIAGQLSLVVEKGRLYADLLQAKADLEAANRRLSQVATLDVATRASLTARHGSAPLGDRPATAGG